MVSSWRQVVTPCRLTHKDDRVVTGPPILSEKAQAGTLGFTLIEVLAVLALAGLIFAFLSQGFRYGLSSREFQARTLRGDGDATIFDQTLRGWLPESTPVCRPLTHPGSRERLMRSSSMSITVTFACGLFLGEAQWRNTRTRSVR